MAQNSATLTTVGRRSMAFGTGPRLARIKSLSGPMLRWMTLGGAVALNTVGVSMSIRLRLRPPNYGYLEDPSVVAIYAGCYMAVMALVAANWSEQPAGFRRSAIAMGALAAVVATSTVLSAHQPHTLVAAVMFAGSVATGVFAASVPLAQRLAVFVLSLQTCVAAGLWASWRGWEYAVQPTGEWAGIFFNRNSFAPVAAVAAACTIGLVAVSFSRACRHVQRKHGWAFAVAGAFFGTIALTLDGVAIVKSGSVTSPSAMVVAVLVVGAVALRRRFTAAWLSAGLVAVGVLGFGLAITLPLWAGSIDGAFMGRDTTFSGRTLIWESVRGWIGERPVQGWGWTALWQDRALITDLSNQAGTWVPSAHNSYLEALLGLGVPIGAVFIGVVVGGYISVLRHGLRQGGPGPLWAVLVATYVLIASVFESFIDGNQLATVLLVCSVVACGVNPEGADSAGSSDRH